MSTTPPTARRTGAGTLSFLFSGILLGACASHEPAPLDPAWILSELDGQLQHTQALDPDGVSSDELVRFALDHNPDLARARARLDVSSSLLEAAGRLRDPALGWDGMGALAAELVGDGATSVDFLAGLELAIPLPRPGERDAERDLAEAELRQALALVTAAEWRLAHEVLLARVDLLELRSLRADQDAILEDLQALADHFERAYTSGAATALAASLARAELLGARGDALALEARQLAARQRLCALLGLPPWLDLALAGALGDDVPTDKNGTADEATERALHARPDLAAKTAAYEAAEAAVALSVARQVPELTLGTVLGLAPRLWSGGWRTDIDLARALRTEAGLDLTASVHALRAEVHAAHARRTAAARRLGYLEQAVLPNAAEGLDLATRSLQAGEATLVELLPLERALFEARTDHTEAHAELARASLDLAAADGSLLTTHDE